MTPHYHSTKPVSDLDIYAVQARLVWATERDVEARFLDTETSSDEFIMCWLIERGHVRVDNDDESVEVKEGQWLILRAAEGHQHFSPGSRLISLRFDLRLRGGEPLFSRQRNRVLSGKDFPMLETAARSLLRLINPQHGSESHLIARSHMTLAHNFRVEAAFMTWVAAYVEMMEATGATQASPKQRDERINLALSLIENHPMREKFSESELAKSCSLSLNQFARLFQREMAKSPFQYYDERRLELARHALNDTAMPIKEIAYELGFSSSPHFSNWFKDKEGRSPRAWRARQH